MNPASPLTVLLVPGLRDHVPEHWQTRLQERLRARGRKVGTLTPQRVELDCAVKVAALERTVQTIKGPIVLVAHSAGCAVVAHWASQSRLSDRIRGALLAAPPDLESPMPEGHPSLDDVYAAGWLPVPRARLPFPCIVAASRNDPFGHFSRIATLAQHWGAELVDLGHAGHLNPASGYGEWPLADQLIARLAQG